MSRKTPSTPVWFDLLIVSAIWYALTNWANIGDLIAFVVGGAVVVVLNCVYVGVRTYRRRPSE